MSAQTLATTPEVLGKLLANIRRSRKLTQADLALRMGMRQATISSLENHARSSSIDTLFRALAALGLELHVQPIPDDDAHADW